MRYYTPTLRLMLIGNGPALAGMAQMAQMLGCDVTIAASDEATLISLAQAGQSTMPVREMDDATFEQLDFASAAVLFFHAHDEEPGILRHLVKTDCFYIGALGNHAVHRARLLALKAAGAADSDISRIRAPMGSIANAKTKATLAVSVLAELMGEAKARHLVA
jgi:xanthine dehydrogenase accessory factor